MIYKANFAMPTGVAFKTMKKADVDYIYAAKDRYKALWYARELAIKNKDELSAAKLRKEALQLQAEIHQKYDIIL